MTTDSNPYAPYPLYVPREWHESYQRHGDPRHNKGEEDLDATPFPRMIDMWWTALCIGLREGRRSKLGENPAKFADGVILGGADSWRVTHLNLVAIAEMGAEALDRPSDILRMAMEYAATGTPILVQALVGTAKPAKPLASFLRRLTADGE